MLSYQHERTRTRLVVPYLIRAGQIIVPITAAHPAGWAAVGAEIRLDVAGTSPADVRWRVRVSAVAMRLPRVGLLHTSRPSTPRRLNGLDPAGLLRGGLLLADVHLRGLSDLPMGWSANQPDARSAEEPNPERVSPGRRRD